MPSIIPTPPTDNQLTRPTQNWWLEFGNPELNQLIETALANNFDLRAALARIEQADRQARIVDGARSPSIDFFSGLNYNAPALGAGTAATRDDWYTRRTFQLGFRVNYEVDLWGRQGAEARSALELARANAFNREVVALTLVAETTAAYFQYLSLLERIEIAEGNRALALNVAQALQRRLQRGDASLIEQQQQQIVIALIDNNLASLNLQKERIITRMAVYLGKPPGTIKLIGKNLRDVQLPAVQPGLPSELLCRRPDVRRVEAELASASADVQAARANLLPSFALNGQFGQGSFNLSDLLSPQSLLYSLAGNLTSTVFDDERKENRLAQTRARNRELLEQYANVVLSSLREVEDSLAGIRLTAKQQAALSEALQRNSRLLELSERVYRLGAIDYIGLLDLQRNVYLAQDAEANARFEQVRATIDLFKALGGGLTDRDARCETPSATASSTPPPKPTTPAPMSRAQPQPSGRLAAGPAAAEAAQTAAQEAQAQVKRDAEGVKK